MDHQLMLESYSPRSIVDISNVNSINQTKSAKRYSLQQQSSDNNLFQRPKEEKNISIFHPQQTFKLKMQNSVIYQGQGIKSTTTENELDKSVELSGENKFQKQRNGSVHVLSDYFDRGRLDYKQLLLESNINDVKNEIPFKAKYFLQDVASQILKENESVKQLDTKLSAVFNKAQTALSRILKCSTLKQTFVDSIHNFWFNKIPILNPYSNFKLVWDSWIAGLTLFILYIFSLRILFQETNIGDIFDIYQFVFISLGIVFWTLDIFIELNTAILDRGELIEDKKYIQTTYLKKRLAFDVLGIIPILQILLHPNGENLYFDFLIILKLKHFAQTLSRIDYYLSYQQDKKNMMDLVKLIFLIMVTTHFIALLWYRLAIFEKEILGYHTTWLDSLKVKQCSFMDLYWQSFYFATVTVYTVGYGDITPVTVIEYNFVTVTILVTGIIFAYAINQIGLIMHNIKQAQTNLKEDLQILNKFMKQKNLNQDLRMRVRNYLEHTHKEFQENNSEHQKKVINKLSPSLLKEMNEDIYKEFIFNNSLFNKIFSAGFLKSTMDLIEEFVATPGEYLFKEGEEDDQSIYFVFEGKVEIKLNQQVISIVTGGKFDEQSKLNESQSQQDKIKTEQLIKNHSSNKMQDDNYNFFSNYLKKQQNNQIKKQKQLKMANILNDKGKKYLNSNYDCFFDLNRLAEEQSGKVSMKRNNIQNIASNLFSFIKNQPKYFGEYNFFSSEKERLYTAQVQEFSRVYKLKRSTFLERIRDYKMDFEKFLEVQDEIILFRHALNFKVACIACGSLTHQHTHCSTIHFIPNRQNLISLLNYTENQERQSIDRWKVKGKKTIALLDDLILDAKKIQEKCRKDVDSILFNIQQYYSQYEITEDSNENTNSDTEEDEARVKENEENIVEDIDDVDESQNEEGAVNESSLYQKQNYQSKHSTKTKEEHESLQHLEIPKDLFASKYVQVVSDSNISPRLRAVTNSSSRLKINTLKRKSLSQDQTQLSSLLSEDSKQIESDGLSSLIDNLKHLEQWENYQNQKNLANQINKFSFTKLNTPNVMSKSKTWMTASNQNQQQIVKSNKTTRNPHISNFKASSIQIKQNKPQKSNANLEGNENGIYKSKKSMKEQINSGNEQIFKLKKSSSLQVLQGGETFVQLPITKETINIIKNSQRPATDPSQLKQNIQLLEYLNKEKEKCQSGSDRANQYNQSNSFVRQITENIMNLFSKQFSQSQQQENQSGLVIRVPSNPVYMNGNITEINKNLQFGVFEKMKEFTFYFQHNNYGNIISQFNYYQDKKNVVIFTKKLKSPKKKKQSSNDKNLMIQSNSKSYENQFIKQQRFSQLQKKDSDENSFNSQNHTQKKHNSTLKGYYSPLSSKINILDK